MNIPQQLQDAANQIAEGIKPIIESIHNGQPTGKDYYPEYMVLISQMKESKPQIPVKFWGIVLIKAGCNVNGVEAAVRLSWSLHPPSPPLYSL